MREKDGRGARGMRGEGIMIYDLSCVAMIPAGVQCPDPGSLADGRRFGDSFQVDEAVLFQCFDPFALDGESVLTCQEDGTWNHATPTCTQRSATGSRRSRRGKV